VSAFTEEGDGHRSAEKFTGELSIDKIAERVGLTKSPDGTWRDPSMSEAA
jgi:hypothetical protein